MKGEEDEHKERIKEKRYGQPQYQNQQQQLQDTNSYQKRNENEIRLWICKGPISDNPHESYY